MESQQISECKKKLQQFLQNTIQQNIRLQQLANIINPTADRLLQSLRAFDEAPLINSEPLAAEIITAKNEITTYLQNTWVKNIISGNDGTTQQALVWQHIRQINYLARLYCKQQTQNVDSGISVAEIQQKVETLLTHVSQVQRILNEVNQSSAQMLQMVLQMQMLFQLPQNCPSLIHLSGLTQLIDESLKTGLMELKKQIIERLSLLVEKQPPSVIMKAKKPDPDAQRRRKQAGTNFATSTQISVRLLNIPGYAPELQQQNALQLNIALIGETGAQEIEKNGFKNQVEIKTQLSSKEATQVSANRGIILQTCFETSQDVSNGIKANVTDISVLDPDREQTSASGKKLKVFEEKLYFLFTASFSLPTDNPSTRFNITTWALSSPTIVCTHSKQAADALATVSWQKHFSDNSQILPELKIYATISEILHALNLHFTEFNKEISLEEQRLKFLKNLLLESLHDVRINVGSSTAEPQISLARFYYEDLPGRNFSFWTWFQAAAKVLNRRYLRELFRKGYFAGFISKTDAQNLLTGTNGEKRPGDFLLRFSQGKPGEISAVFVAPNCEFEVVALKIENSSEDRFKTTFMENMYGRLRSGEQAFVRLYPDFPKESVFPQDEKSIEKPRVGYTPLRLTVDAGCATKL